MKLSYTSASDFQQCKKKYFHKHIARDVPYETSEAMDYGNRVHKAFEDYLSAGKVFPDDLRHLQAYAQALDVSPQGCKVLVEQRLAVRENGTTCSFYDNDCFWKGKVDVAIMNDVTCAIFDWKTGKVREDPWELRVQSVLLCAAYPDLQTFKGRYVWLREKRVGQLHNLSKSLNQTWMEMQTFATLIKRSQQTSYWPPMEGPLCAYCPVRQCQFNRNDAPVAAK